MFDIKKCKDLDLIDAYIENKVSSDDNDLFCENVKNLSENEKTAYCAFHFYLEQMNDGFISVFTGYMSPLLYEIRSSLEKINAVENLKLLNEAIKKINTENKSEEEFLEDVINEELYCLDDEETEEEYSKFLSDLDKKVPQEEDIQKLIIEYLSKN